jgi:hypothetical protein
MLERLNIFPSNVYCGAFTENFVSVKTGKGKRTAHKYLHAHFKKVFGFIFLEAKSSHTNVVQN